MTPEEAVKVAALLIVFNLMLHTMVAFWILCLEKPVRHNEETCLRNDRMAANKIEQLEEKKR